MTKIRFALSDRRTGRLRGLLGKRPTVSQQVSSRGGHVANEQRCITSQTEPEEGLLNIVDSSRFGWYPRRVERLSCPLDGNTMLTGALGKTAIPVVVFSLYRASMRRRQLNFTSLP
jgi:hypothetical protein